MEATIRREKLIIPTYGQGAAEELPLFSDLRINQGTRGYIYPYRMSDKLTMVKEDKAYDAIRLENDFIRVTVLPELGGRIYEGYDKVNDYNFVYKNNVIKPALIGLCGTTAPPPSCPSNARSRRALTEKRPPGWARSRVCTVSRAPWA